MQRSSDSPTTSSTTGVLAVDKNQEKDTFENDPLRARAPGADAALTEKDTAANESPDAAAGPDAWQKAAPKVG